MVGAGYTATREHLQSSQHTDLNNGGKEGGMNGVGVEMDSRSSPALHAPFATGNLPRVCAEGIDPDRARWWQGTRLRSPTRRVTTDLRSYCHALVERHRGMSTDTPLGFRSDARGAGNSGTNSGTGPELPTTHCFNALPLGAVRRRPLRHCAVDPQPRAHCQVPCGLGRGDLWRQSLQSAL